MADDDKKDDQDMSEDEKLAAEWEAAMEEAGDGSEAQASDTKDSQTESADAAPAENRDDEWAAAMAEAGAEDPEESVRAAPMEEFGVDTAVATGGGPAPDLDVILDIPVTISMEVGNTQIPIRNLLQLNQGSVIELDRLAGEPLDVLVNGTLIAHGEVVMVNEKFGIRLTDVISPAERIKRLQK
ncbi:flagellar motor switch protein FliN [Marinobacter sp. SS21]|uniref:flagellar motor switch protein FliN n=1 Tax=Marinobacter sp. SS21 TaxID=2979460 RepID=UPI00232ED7F6|nr:flagellar motor switch protein FliN [Marinobacter sp. SS21]MDC0662162.1 flagellar motor switch protein FliN [Marinobacter sp. SS21]